MAGISMRRSRDPSSSSSSSSSSGAVRRRRLDTSSCSARQTDAAAAEMKREEILSHIEKMRRLEEEVRVPEGFLTGNLRTAPSDASTVIVDEECRSKMCVWCYQVADHCNIRRETVCIAMSYLDRYLCTEEGAKACLSDRKSFQLAAMTSLYTSIKLFEDVIVEPRIMVELSRGSYTTEDFVRMELDMLVALRWRVYRLPTPLSFVENFIPLAITSFSSEKSCLLPALLLSSTWTEELVECAKFQTELAIADSSLATVRPSIIAAAAIANAFDLVALPLEKNDTAALHQWREAFLGKLEDLASTRFKSTSVTNISRKLRGALAASDYYQTGCSGMFSFTQSRTTSSSPGGNSQIVKRARNCMDLSPRCASFEVSGTADENDWS